jgi:hypothetical protein
MAGAFTDLAGSSLPEVSKNPPIAAINTPIPPKMMPLLLPPLIGSVFIAFSMAEV